MPQIGQNLSLQQLNGIPLTSKIFSKSNYSPRINSYNNSLKSSPDLVQHYYAKNEQRHAADAV